MNDQSDNTLILVSGFSRGGTSILWNLICSHPNVLSTGIELNEIFGPSRSNISLGWKMLIEIFALTRLPVPAFASRYAHDRIRSFAVENSTLSWGKWKTHEERYESDEITSYPVCTKSVNSWARDSLFAMLQRNIALKYNRILLTAYQTVKTVYIIRDGESQCNGWMRRGCDPYEAGKWYRKIVGMMLADRERRKDDVMFVNFHDLIHEPIQTINRVYGFLGLPETNASHYRLKTKKVLKEDGTHDVVTGTEGEMVWVSRDELSAFLDSGIDERQRSELDETTLDSFREGLGDIIERLGDVVGTSQ